MREGRSIAKEGHPITRKGYLGMGIGMAIGYRAYIVNFYFKYINIYTYIYIYIYIYKFVYIRIFYIERRGRARA